MIRPRRKPATADSVRLRSLYDYGLATVSDPARVDLLDTLFAADRPPRCTTRF